jgi:hypothetical protein
MHRRTTKVVAEAAESMGHSDNADSMAAGTSDFNPALRTSGTFGWDEMSTPFAEAESS